MLRKISRLLLMIVGAFAGIIIIAKICLALTAPIPDRIDLKEGDILLQTNFDLQGIAVMLASGSPYTHMGFLKHSSAGLMVVEAVDPVTETPINQWIARGAGKRIAVMRVKDLRQAALQKIFARARKDYGKPYDFYFMNDDRALYCSELVRNSFAAAGITLGRLEKVSELAPSVAMNKLIKQRWKNYPLCKDLKDMTEEKCRGIIMRQTLVTPGSIAEDAQLEQVYSNYPLD